MAYINGFIPRKAMIGVAISFILFALVLLGLGAGAISKGYGSGGTIITGGIEVINVPGQCATKVTCCTKSVDCCNCAVLVTPQDPLVNYCVPFPECSDHTETINTTQVVNISGGTPKMNAAGAFSIIAGTFGALFMGYVAYAAISDDSLKPSSMVWAACMTFESACCLIAFALWASEVDYVNGLWSLASANLAFSVVCFVMTLVIVPDEFVASRKDESSV